MLSDGSSKLNREAINAAHNHITTSHAWRFRNGGVGASAACCRGGTCGELPKLHRLRLCVCCTLHAAMSHLGVQLLDLQLLGQPAYLVDCSVLEAR